MIEGGAREDATTRQRRLEEVPKARHLAFDPSVRAVLGVPLAIAVLALVVAAVAGAGWVAIGVLSVVVVANFAMWLRLLFEVRRVVVLPRASEAEAASERHVEEPQETESAPPEVVPVAAPVVEVAPPPSVPDPDDGAQPENEGCFRLLFESSVLGTAIVDPSGVFVEVNHALCDILGYSADALIGMTVGEVTYGDDPDMAHPMVRSFWSGERASLALTKRYRNQDGRVVHAEITLSPVKGEDGSVRFALVQIHDVTEQRRVDEQRRMLLKAVEQSASVVVITDPEGHMEFVNEQFTRLTGYSYTEAIGKRASLIKSGRTPPEVYEDLWTTVLAGKQWTGVFENRKKSGELYWESARIAPVLDVDGNIQRIIAVKEDITARKAAEEALERRVRDLSALSEMAMVVSQATDLETLFCKALRGALGQADVVAGAILLNDVADEVVVAAQVGMHEQAYAVGRRIPCGSEVLAPLIDDERPLVTAGLGRDASRWLYETPEAVHSDVVMALGTKQRRLGKLRLGLSLHEVDEERLRLFEALARQLANGVEKVLLVRSMRESEQRYRTLFENAPIGLGLFDRSGRIIAFNDAMIRPGGYDHADVEEKGWSTTLFADPEDEQRMMAMFARDGAVDRLEVEFKRKDGDTFTNLVTLRSALVDGRPCLLAMTEDISARRDLEGQMRAAQKMEALGRLAGGVAHDFNNILTAIMSFAGFVRDDLEEGDTRRDDIDEVLRAAGRASRLTRQLLAFSRRTRVEPQIVDLNQLVFDLDKMLRRLVGADIEMVVLPGPDLGRVRVDPGQLEQVLVNLVVNARDAMADGGTLTIELGNRRFASLGPDGVPPGDYVSLLVRDTGCGMDDATLDRLFEPFFTTKPKEKGTGLGLATSYGIISQFGGHVRVESALGEGSTFRIYLPRAEGWLEERASDEESTSGAGGRETVLVVEDEPAVRALAARTLRARGYHVLEAGSGAEALEVLASYDERIDLLLSDVVMPKMSGTELAVRFRELRPDARVLLMSGYTDEESTRGGLLEAGAAFLEKPFMPDALAARVRRVLDAVV